MSAAIIRSARFVFVLAAVGAATGLCGCAHDGYAPRAATFPDIGYSSWDEQEPAYRIFPGDVLDVGFPSAPELNREVTVQPDGRVSLPLIGPMMAADLSVTGLQGSLSQAYVPLLVRPEVDVSVRAATPLRIFVGGEVAKPGVYDMAGDIDALQAIVTAGGFTDGAKRHDVIVIRRGPDGRPLMKVVDLRAALANPIHTDLTPLRRFDVVFVPKSSVANADLFVQQYIRDLVPVSFSYALTGGLYGVSP